MVLGPWLGQHSGPALATANAGLYPPVVTTADFDRPDIQYGGSLRVEE